MYYENQSKKTSAYLIHRPSGTVALRVIVGREKFEQALFKWPAEYFDQQNRMILPRGNRDADYIGCLEEALAVMRKAQAVLESASGGIEAFKSGWLRGAASPMLSVYMGQVLSGRRVRESSIRQYRFRAGALCALLGEVKLSDVSEKHLKAIDSHCQSKGISPKAYHEMLRRVLEHAVEAGAIDSSPYARFKGRKPDRKPRRVAELGADAVQALWDAWEREPEGKLRSAMQLLLLQCFTGARYSDACRISEADVERGVYVSLKTGAVCPLVKSDRVGALAKAGLPVYIRYKAFRYRLALISDRLGYDYRHTHDGRRFFASALNEESGDLMVVRQALGHSSVVTTERYVKPSAGRLRQAALKMGRM